jgi:hypothetical protein
MSMILKDHMFKIDLSRFLKIASRIFKNFLGCPKKQSRLQVDEILNCFTFLVNGHLKFTYALSTSKVKIIIYQSFNVKLFLNTIPLVNFKITFGLFLVY